MSDRRPLVFDWACGLVTGWGQYGLNLAKYARDRYDVMLLSEPEWGCLPEDNGSLAWLRELPVVSVDRVPAGALSLTGLGNYGQGNRGGWPIPVKDPWKSVGVIFSEDTHFAAADVARLNEQYAAIIAGSSWNAAVLRKAGVKKVEMVRQGVDLATFCPRWDASQTAPHRCPVCGTACRCADWYDGRPCACQQHAERPRFRVFSGGKLEWRKGQDIVVAAFRELLTTVPDAQLVVSWVNLWPTTMQGLDVSGHVKGYPEPNWVAPHATGPHLLEWLERNGVPRRNVEDVGVVAHRDMAKVLRSCDVAVFPNRCEGGTNLVAMEAMACGVPPIFSYATGHLDLLPSSFPAALDGKRDPAWRTTADLHPVNADHAASLGIKGVDGWCEPSVVDILHRLRKYESFSPATLAHDGRRIYPRWMTGWDWQDAISRLLDTCEAV